jgi:biopolymer transport protein ExbB
MRVFMTRHLALSFATAALCLGPTGAAEPAASPAPAEIASSAKQDLEKSLADLAALREEILAAKVPLMKELTAVEGRLAELRRRHDERSRERDAVNLEITNLESALKLRQEEAAYVANLLDEYGRGFEASIHVSEKQRYAPLVEAARKAAESADVDPRERFERRTALLRASISRLDDLIGGAKFPGEAVGSEGIVSKGEFAAVGPVVLFSAGKGGPTGLAVPQTGSPLPAVRRLDPALDAGLSDVVVLGAGMLPIDPTRGGALTDLVSRGNLAGYFKKGGPIMWPLLFVSILALSVILERLFFLARVTRHRDAGAVEAILESVTDQDVQRAIRAGEGSKDFVARALTYALLHREKSLSNALLRAAGLELVRFNRAVPILDTCVTMAPLLGLLGTVTGMMRSFGMLGGADLSAPAQITGGIAEALIATAFGLGIAVTALIPMNFLHTRAEAARHELEDASTHLELLMKPILEDEREGRHRRPAVRDASGAAGAAGAAAMAAEAGVSLAGVR